MFFKLNFLQNCIVQFLTRFRSTVFNLERTMWFEKCDFLPAVGVPEPDSMENASTAVVIDINQFQLLVFQQNLLKFFCNGVNWRLSISEGLFNENRRYSLRPNLEVPKLCKIERFSLIWIFFRRFFQNNWLTFFNRDLSQHYFTCSRLFDSQLHRSFSLRRSGGYYEDAKKLLVLQ